MIVAAMPNANRHAPAKDQRVRATGRRNGDLPVFAVSDNARNGLKVAGTASPLIAHNRRFTLAEIA